MEERAKEKDTLLERIKKTVTYFNELNSKVNLLTLTIRDKEMEEQYAVAREKYYWLTIVVIEVLREIT